MVTAEEVNNRLDSYIEQTNGRLQTLEDKITNIQTSLKIIFHKLNAIIDDPPPRYSSPPQCQSNTAQERVDTIEPNVKWVGKDKILVQTRGKGRRSDFYILDLKYDKVVEKVVGGNILWNHSNRDGLIVVDSTVYAVGSAYNYDDGNDVYHYPSSLSSLSLFPPDDDDGGDYHIHSGASFLDLADTGGGRWKNIGGMINRKRSSPACASLGDKIFVFIGSYVSRDCAFGEFYDKKKCCWEAIPFPPLDSEDCKFSISPPIVSDPKHNRLLCYFNRIYSLYAYYPDNKQWVCLDPNMESWDGEVAPFPVDDVLYFVDCGYSSDTNIIAYDLSTNRPLHVSWSSSSAAFYNKLQTETFTYMLYLGDNILCLPTIGYRDGFFEFYRFQVCRTSQDQVQLTPLSIHRIPVQGFNSPINTLAL